MRHGTLNITIFDIEFDRLSILFEIAAACAGLYLTVAPAVLAGRERARLAAADPALAAAATLAGVHEFVGFDATKYQYTCT